MFIMFGKYASALNSDFGIVNDMTSDIKGISFESNWSSLAGDVLIDALNENLNVIYDLESQIDLFELALYLVDEYIVIVEKIAKLERLIAEEMANPSLKITETYIDDGQEKTRTKYVVDQAKIDAWQAEIAILEQKRLDLKERILSLLASIKGVELSEIPGVSYTGVGDFEFICDLKWLENGLNGLHSYGNIAKKLDGGQQYIDARLNAVLSKYKGREAAVNYALMCGMLSIEAGTKIPYVNEGQNLVSVPYNNSGQLSDGMDCCSGVSLWVNAGTPGQKGFQWGHVQTFNSIAENNNLYVDISSALPGDVLVDRSSSFNHVVMIVGNNPENGTVTIAEFSGDGFDIVTEPYSAYGAVNMESYYNGELTYKHPGN